MESAFAKLGRAKVHCDQLVREIKAFDAKDAFERCGRYAYQRVLMHSTNPDHLVPSTPSLTDIPPLQVVRRIGGTVGP